jgi:hypothetical protein
MKTKSTLSKGNIFNFISILLTSAGFGYALMNQFFFNHHNNKLLFVTCFLFVAAVDYCKRNKISK